MTITTLNVPPVPLSRVAVDLQAEHPMVAGQLALLAAASQSLTLPGLFGLTLNRPEMQAVVEAIDRALMGETSKTSAVAKAAGIGRIEADVEVLLKSRKESGSNRNAINQVCRTRVAGDPVGDRLRRGLNDYNDTDKFYRPSFLHAREPDWSHVTSAIDDALDLLRRQLSAKKADP